MRLVAEDSVVALCPGSLCVADATRVASAIVRVACLDFSGQILKLTHPSEGYRFDPGRAGRACDDYRRFLAILAAFPELQVAPTAEIDLVWHLHILDTRAYARDTQSVFGFFLHHFPYLGLRGGNDDQLLGQAFRNGRVLFQTYFPESQAYDEGIEGSCGGGSCSSCSSCGRIE